MAARKFQKLEPGGARIAGEPGGLVNALIKVREAGYRPPHAVVRAELHPYLFTAELMAEDLPSLDADPKVESISLSTPLPLQKPPRQG
jgi:hypothetical protein